MSYMPRSAKTVLDQTSLDPRRLARHKKIQIESSHGIDPVAYLSQSLHDVSGGQSGYQRRGQKKLSDPSISAICSILVFLGSCAILLQVLLIIEYRNGEGGSFISSGIWSGLGSVITGWIGFKTLNNATKSKSFFLFVASVLATVSDLTALVLVIFSVIWCMDEESDKKRFCETNIIINSILGIIISIQVICLVVVSVISGQAYCSRSIVRSYNPNAPENLPLPLAPRFLSKSQMVHSSQISLVQSVNTVSPDHSIYPESEPLPQLGDFYGYLAASSETITTDGQRHQQEITGRVSTNRRPSFHLLPYERNIVSRSSFH